MTRAGHCFNFPSSEADGEVEETDFVRDQRVFENERRRSLHRYLEKLKCEPLKRMETNVCNNSVEKNQPSKVRRSKKVIRRSSALVKSRRVPVENSCCCSDSASPEPPYCHSRMNVVHDCGGSILRGKTQATETQTSRSHSRNTFLGISRTKGSENWRTENMSKFSPVRNNISSGFCERLPSCETPSSDKCCCFSNTRLKKPVKNYQKIRFHSQDHFPKSNDCVITTASTSEEEIIDYQVPVQPCSSSHRFYETGSETKTLVPTSSHVTIRICSQNSSSSLQGEHFDAEEDDRPRLSRSENSLNHLEERVRRSLRAMCCCDNPGDDNLEEKFDDDEVSLKPGSLSFTECQINSTPRSGRKTCCCKCREDLRPTIGFVQSSDEGSFQRFKDVLTETRRRKGHRKTSTCHSKADKNFTKSERTMCGPKRPRKMASKRISNPIKNHHKEMTTCIDRHVDRSPFPDPPITLSTQKYKEFLNRCECIRKSFGNIIRAENNYDCKPASKEIPVWKGDVMNLGDLKPDLPPLDHWSQYEDGMRKMANEYKVLKSCVNSIETETEKENPSCCCTEKSITRTYPSGTEFTFRVKKVPDKKACQISSGPIEEPSLFEGSKKSASIHRSENFRGKSRSVCFEKSKREKQPCCDCPGETTKPRSNFSSSNTPTNIEAIKSREADLVRTLETFCEKMKSMKSEFDKSSTSGYFKDSGCCQRCGRGRKSPRCNRMKAKKLLIFPPEGENGPPLTLHKKSSSVNCKVKGDQDIGFRYNVIYIQRFVSSRWNPDKGTNKCCMDSG